MTKKWLGIFLLVEVLCIVNALVAFRVFHDERFTAAIMASCGFVGGVGFIYFVTRGWDERTKSLTYWFSWVNLFLTCLPMLIVRMITPEHQSIATVAGFDAKYFHRISEIMFMVLIIATVIDLARCYRKSKIKL